MPLLLRTNRNRNEIVHHSPRNTSTSSRHTGRLPTMALHLQHRDRDSNRTARIFFPNSDQTQTQSLDITRISTRNQMDTDIRTCQTPIAVSSQDHLLHHNTVQEELPSNDLSPARIRTLVPQCDPTLTRAIASNRRWRLLHHHLPLRNRLRQIDECTNYHKLNRCTPQCLELIPI